MNSAKKWPKSRNIVGGLKRKPFPLKKRFLFEKGAARSGMQAYSGRQNGGDSSFIRRKEVLFPMGGNEEDGE